MAVLDDAKVAMGRVWARWGAHIPPELKRFKAEDIFRFHSSNSTFMSAFTLTFQSTFKKAGGLTCSADSCGSGCGGFVTPTLSHEARLIHIHPDNLKKEFDPITLMMHEYIHFLSHPKFYPQYYKVGGGNPFRVEGATEWLCFECFTDLSHGFDVDQLYQQDPNWTNSQLWRMISPQHDVGNPVSYVSEYEKMDSFLKADTNNLTRLLDFMFNGVTTDLSGIRP